MRNLSIETKLSLAGMVLNRFKIPVNDNIRRKVYKQAITSDVLEQDEHVETFTDCLYRYAKGLINADYHNTVTGSGCNVIKIALPSTARRVTVTAEVS